MRNRIAAPLAFCAVMLAAPAPLAAQLPGALSVEARLGGAFATGDFAASGRAFEAGSGYAASVNGRLGLFPGLEFYVGYERAQMPCDACAATQLDDTLVDDGIGAGAILELPLDLPGLSPWVRAGLVRRQLRISGFGETMASKPGIGFDLGAGITLPLSGPIKLTPGVRYLNYPAEFDFQLLPDRSIDVSHFGVDVGLAYQF